MVRSTVKRGGGTGTRGKRGSTRARDINKIITKGLRYEKKGNKKAAANCYLEAFNLDPRNLDALKLIGKTLSELGNRHLALQVFEQALAGNENDTDVISALGNMALDMNYPELALKMFSVFTALEPGSFVGYNNQATALRQLERFDEAIATVQHAIPLFPTAAELWNTLASIVTERDGLEASLVFYEEALRLNPKMVSAASNLARAYNHTGYFDKTIEVAGRAIEIDPEFIEAHFVISTALLATGQLKRGWAEYEWRKHPARRDVTLYTHGVKRWEGDDLTGKRLLICAEQGIGDELLFASCFPDIIDKAEQLVIGCDSRLVSLYERSFPGSLVGHYADFYANGTRHRHFPFLEEAGPIDFAIECGSLPRYLRSDFDSFPERRSFLEPDPARVAHWRSRLDAIDGNLKVGICWRSGVITHERSKEYTSLEQWGPILTTPGVTFVNLQYDECTAELDAAKEKFGVTIHGWDDLDLKNDFEATTSLSRALDLVICPTTAPGITAASVGTEWWALARIQPWWCYGQEQSPEVKVCTIMLVPEGGDWGDVTAELGLKLDALVKRSVNGSDAADNG
ncbi:MAG: tetratricopeptide repeat protein [Sphingomonadales bacterium]